MSRQIVAIVEDNPDNRLLVSIVLGDEYDTREFETALEALAAFGEQTPDIVLLDIALPGMDGVELVRLMRADPALARVPVVALTAHAMRGDRERYIAAGCDDYVSKPIEDLGVFKAIVAAHLATTAGGGRR
jgi:CheY-like chemotaxis protein